MLDHISKCDSYHYLFYKNLGGSTIKNELSVQNNGKPQWNNKYHDDRRVLYDGTRQLGDLGNPPEWTDLGVMFREQSALRTPSSGHSLVTNPPYTIIIWVYVLIIEQESCLFGKVNIDNYDRNNIGYYLNQGRLMIRTSKWRNWRNRRNLGDHRQLNDCYDEATHNSTSSSMYGLGWNLISFTENSSGIKLRSANNFGSFISESKTVSLNYNSENHAILGAWRNDWTLYDSPKAIIHTLWIMDSDLTDTDLEAYIAPRSGCTGTWDYYVGMYKDLTAYNSSNVFLNSINLISSESSISITFKHNGCTLESDGLYIPSDKKIELKDRNYDSWPAVTYHLWFKGTIDSQSSASTSEYFMYLHAGGGERPAYLARVGNDIIFNSKETSDSHSTLSGVFTNDNNDWMLLGISMGWLGDNSKDDHVICAYFYQSGNTEASDWLFTDNSYSGSKFREGEEAKFKIENLQGHVKELYVLDYVQFPYLFSKYQSTDAIDRYHCRTDNQYYTDPGHIWNGCPNYVTLAGESDTCDDGNTDNNDGCASDWTNENLFSWSPNSIGVSVCAPSWGDGVFESAAQEQWDDNNTDTADGCDDSCLIESTHTCTAVEGQLSTCSPKWGDGTVFSPEIWDDGNKDDGIGCKSDCSGTINGYTWTGGNANSASSWASDCGDNYITVDEGCDDNNTDPGDGCSSTCTIEAGFNCTNNTAMTLTTCTEIWGDGLKVGNEIWDDGDQIDADKCNSTWTGNVNGWNWTGGNSTSSSTCAEVWGDGYITAGEQCDDNNTDPNDGCSSTCTVEIGFNWTNNANMILSTCIEIWGDGLRVGNELCDDGDNTDSIGCKNDWSGRLDGYNCQNGTTYAPDVWITVWGDGYYRGAEQCDDNGTTTGDGWDNNCNIEPGFSCQNYPSFSSVWGTTCGDGLKSGVEIWDDGDDADSQGCEDDWSGVMLGWSCSGGTSTTPDIWNTVWGDGIHISINEECDDGNTVDLNDGWGNTCTIENKWSWRDDVLQKSIWQPMCGNGFNDHTDEQWDDGNYQSEDGCSDQWIVESSWECINNDNDTVDEWYMQPTLSVSSVSSDNMFTITFSQKMVQFSPIGDTDIEYWMTGPISNYKVTLESRFTDDYTVEIAVTTTTPFTGDDSEYLHLRFNETTFVSQNGTTLYNNETSGNTNKIPVYPDLVKAAGEGSNWLMTTSMVVIISANVALGQSCELLWAFVNTIQIIYFMPLMSLYYPDHYSRFLTYLTSARVQVDFIGFAKDLPQVSDTIGSDVDMPALNQRYEDIGYDSTSFLMNADEMLTTVTSGFVTCIIVFSVKAIIITIRADVSPYKDMLEDIKAKDTEANDEEVNDSEANQREKKKKLGRWMRSKLSFLCLFSIV